MLREGDAIKSGTGLWDSVARVAIVQTPLCCLKKYFLF